MNLLNIGSNPDKEWERRVDVDLLYFAANIEYNDNHREAVHLIFTTEIFFQDSIDF